MKRGIIGLVLLIAFVFSTAPRSFAQIVSTGPGGPGYQGFTVYANDCPNGFVAAASYTPGPDYVAVMKQVTGVGDAGIQNGTLLGQSQQVTGATFQDPHAAWQSTQLRAPVQFYIYTMNINTDPNTSYTIHGTDGNGNLVSAAAGQPPPQPFTLDCTGQAPPPNPGEQPAPGTPAGDPSCGAQGQACCVNDGCDNAGLECVTQ